jgi:hypothetical protein
MLANLVIHLSVPLKCSVGCYHECLTSTAHPSELQSGLYWQGLRYSSMVLMLAMLAHGAILASIAGQ